jgi:hypothetical protein
MNVQQPRLRLQSTKAFVAQKKTTPVDGVA